MPTPLRLMLFDLDGTLLDTAPDMIGALNALRHERGLKALPFDSARSSVSHGSTRLVKLGFPDADPQEFAVLQRRFLELYRSDLSTHTRLFAGMDSVLSHLSRRGAGFGHRHQQAGLAHRSAARAAGAARALRLCGERRYRE